MPRGNPRKLIALRIEPELLAELRERTDNMTAAIEAGIRLWLARQKRQRGEAVREVGRERALAKHLAPPTAREIAGRKGAR